MRQFYYDKTEQNEQLQIVKCFLRFVDTTDYQLICTVKYEFNTNYRNYAWLTTFTAYSYTNRRWNNPAIRTAGLWVTIQDMLSQFLSMRCKNR